MLNQTVQGWEQPTEEVLRAADEAIRHLATLLSTGPWEGVEDKKRAEDLYLATRALMHMLADAGFPGMARPLLAALFDTRDEDLTPEKTRHVIPDLDPATTISSSRLLLRRLLILVGRPMVRLGTADPELVIDRMTGPARAGAIVW